MDLKTILNFRPKNKGALEIIKDLTVVIKKFVKENKLNFFKLNNRHFKH